VLGKVDHEITDADVVTGEEILRELPGSHVEDIDKVAREI
jgi:hypothetical protein